MAVLVDETVPAEERKSPSCAMEAGENEGDEGDPFERLPDELIICNIFNRIGEAKSLYRCSLVSKHFSSLVFQIRALSFTIPRLIPFPPRQRITTDGTLLPHLVLPSLPCKMKLFQFLSAPLKFVHELFSSFLQQWSKPLLPPSNFDPEFFAMFVAEILWKFKSLRSLIVEFDYDNPNSRSECPLSKWNYNSKFNCFALLIICDISYVYDLTTEEEDDDDDVADDDQTDWFLTCFSYHLKMAAFWFSFVQVEVLCLSKSLQSVVVTDSEQHGRLVIDRTELDEMRNPIRSKVFQNGLRRIRIRHAGVLELPSSGSVMKKVTLFMCSDHESAGYGDDRDDFLIVKDAFEEEEEGFYGEAALEMLKKEVIYQRILPKIEFPNRTW